jgi:predicted Rossmann fold flavoprotein
MPRVSKTKPILVKDVCIIGAGAAGLMCAVQCGKRGRTVIALDHKGIGRKILASGGGRCNFTNRQVGAGNYSSGNPHFCKSSLMRFSPLDFIGMITRHGIRYDEKEKGRLFCRGTSGDILRMFSSECGRYGTVIKPDCMIGQVGKDKAFSVDAGPFTVDASSLVVATGGLSYPSLGASDLGFKIARSFGLEVTTLRPALVPLVLNRREVEAYGSLSGISLKVKVSCRGAEFHDEMLFTHRGLSGPAILQISNYWMKGDEIVVDLFPESSALQILTAEKRGRIGLASLLSRHLPRRFAHRWCELNAATKPLIHYSDREVKDIASRLHNWKIIPERTEGYGSAEITSGGVDTHELSSKSMESRKVPGLFFAGEVIDVNGQLGGYNLHWAWASGYAAGQHA